MSLPNPSMDFSAFDTLPAASLDDLVENIEALADGSGLDDGAVTNAKLATGVGQPGGAWTAWTPTWTNLTVGNGTVVASYTQIGKTVKVAVSFLLGTTSAIGTAPTINLPVTPKSTATHARAYFGQGEALDAATATYPLIIESSPGSSTGEIKALGASGTYTNMLNLSATIPMTWGNLDGLVLRLEYEAA